MMQATQPSRALSRRGRANNTTAMAGMHMLRALAKTDIIITPQQRRASSLVSTSTGRAGAAARRSAARNTLLRPTTGCTVASRCSSLVHASGRTNVVPRSEQAWWHGGGRAYCSGNPELLPLSLRSSFTTETGSVFVRGQRGTGAAANVRCREWNMQRHGMSSTAMSERDFHSVADEALEEIHDAVEEALEDGFPGDFDCNMSQGVLNIVVGDRGTWVLNKQSPNRQIWWSSPVSGPMRFEYHEENKRWVNTRDGETELRVILAAEMRDKCGVSL